MSDPSPLVFELCTTIDRFYEREPDLSVSDVLAALDEVSMALACKRARTHWSRANVVRTSNYKGAFSCRLARVHQQSRNAAEKRP
jgi:hypothetical protein